MAKTRSLPTWDTAMHEVGDGCFAYVQATGSLNISNAGLIVGPDHAIAVDALWKERKSDVEGWVRDLVSCSRPFSDDYLDDDPVIVKRIGNEIDEGHVDGEWIGVARLSPRGSEWVRAEIEAMGEDGSLPQSSMLDLLQRLVDKGTSIRAVYVPGQWLDVDDDADFTRADKFL